MPEQAPGKTTLFPVLISILFCVLTLLLASSIPGLLYMSAKGKQSFDIEELILYYGKNLFFFLQLLPFALTLVVLLLCVRYVHKEPVLSVLTRRISFDGKRAGLSFLIWLLVLLAFFLVQLFFTDSQIRWNYTVSFWPLLAFSLLLVPLQIAFEEVLFRGYLLKYVFSSYPKWLGILGTSVLFGLMHLGNPEIALLGKIVLLYYIGTGIFLALLTVLDQGLELALGFHAANNLFATLILTNNWQVFQTDALFKDYSGVAISSDIWIYLLVLFPALIFVYGKRFKWDFGVIFAKFAKKPKQ